MKEPQSYKNHSRIDPVMHYFIGGVLIANVVVSIVHACYRRSWFSLWLVLVSIALITLAFKARLYALKVQDRVIRLEERLRLAALLPEPLRQRIPELTEGQLIALRFASDAEIPALAEKVLAAKMAPAAIKQSIQNWRPDYWRV